MFSRGERIHFVGIGGIGTSAIAQLLQGRGCLISGSDLKATALTEKLHKMGMRISLDHRAEAVNGADLVIYTTALKRDNPELAAARAQGIPSLSRSEALAILANEKKSIAVSGAHGKTTTTCLIAHLLVDARFSPTVCAGGELFGLNGNALSGEGSYFVLEADESDGSFLSLRPDYAVLTNIDREHLDYYRSLKEIEKAFAGFVNNSKDQGRVIFCADDQRLAKIVVRSGRQGLGYGFSKTADIFASGIELADGLSRFDSFYQGRFLGQIELMVPGRHNISNALAAVALGLELGIDFKTIQRSLSTFNGVRRRLELKSRQKQILIFDDYAHHPTEIRASLAALRNLKPKRILAVFQPHRYSRTKFLINDFADCFSDADQLVITDIYAASEAPIPGVSAKKLCQRIRQLNGPEVEYLPKEKILAYLLERLRSGDLVAVLGAGDIGDLSDALVKELQNPGPF